MFIARCGPAASHPSTARRPGVVRVVRDGWFSGQVLACGPSVRPVRGPYSRSLDPSERVPAPTCPWPPRGAGGDWEARAGPFTAGDRETPWFAPNDRGRACPAGGPRRLANGQPQARSPPRAQKPNLRRRLPRPGTHSNKHRYAPRHGEGRGGLTQDQREEPSCRRPRALRDCRRPMAWMRSTQGSGFRPVGGTGLRFGRLGSRPTARARAVPRRSSVVAISPTR